MQHVFRDVRNVVDFLRQSTPDLAEHLRLNGTESVVAAHTLLHIDDDMRIEMSNVFATMGAVNADMFAIFVALGETSP
ncbi:MAG: hypothetical protein MHM6MM_007943 [Cercozoa sp. M6MM]